MNRRQMLGGLGIVAATAACGTQTPREGTSTKGNAKLLQTRTARLRLAFSGLSVFVATDGHYKVGLLDPTKVKDRMGTEYFKTHNPMLLLDDRVRVSGGTRVLQDELDDLNLMTDLTGFWKWPLKDLNVEIAGLETGPTIAALGATLPLRDMYDGNGKIPDDWHKAQHVHATVMVQEGLLFSGVPRQWDNGRQNVRWKLKDDQAPDGTYWKNIKDTPRLLSDVVEYDALVPEKTKITLYDRATSTVKEVIDTNATAATGLEIWIINESAKGDHSSYEMSHQWELQQVAAFYQLFNSPPTKNFVPTANKDTYPGSDPIFCPPAEA